MAKTFILQFGTGNPAAFTGLSPTLSVFKLASDASSITAPAVSEVGTTGLYKFVYGPTVATVFVVDGGSGLSSSDRYISGVLDPIQAVDQPLGDIGSSYGDNSTDPTTVFGYVKRSMEFNEGDANFDKSNGVWDIYSRGASTLLREKTLTNESGTVTKD
jgi:hypothetical protein